jgi:two-component system response regulator GlrR
VRKGAESNTLDAPAYPRGPSVRRFTLNVVGGPSKGEVWRSVDVRSGLGSHPSNACVLADPSVSRFHCELVAESAGLKVRDLDSKNGTVLDGVRVCEAFAKSGSTLRLGHTVAQLQFGTEQTRLVLSASDHFGSLRGQSNAMRAAFALLERAAASDATVLLEGETGTGKGVAAEAIHESSARQAGPFVLVDCGAISPQLLESELFGHEKGAFTGALARRVGAFEHAQGGTVFLDEVGELPLDLQPKLLHVLEKRKIRRIGSNDFFPVNVRIVAATHRDLRELVNAGQFRPDLYFRLAVVRVFIPPLRAHMEDLPAVARVLLESLGAPAEQVKALLAPEAMLRLQHAAWPGNVRELRNYLERCMVMDGVQPLPMDGNPDGAGAGDSELPLAEARSRLVEDFERRYVQRLLQANGGKVSEVARAAGVDRGYIYRLMRRYRLSAHE